MTAPSGVSSRSSSDTDLELTPGDRIDFVLAAEASVLSCISVIVIFIWICRNVLWYREKFPTGKWRLFQRPFDIYMFSLFAFDFLQSMAGILNIKWAHSGIVTAGPYCTAQALFNEIGLFGVALSTLLLAFHTFVAAVWQVGLNARVFAFTMVSLACVFITLLVAVGPSVHKDSETHEPTLCWISSQYAPEVAIEYIWQWIALSTSIILYVPLYFWAEGFWAVGEDYRFHWSSADRRVGYAQRRAALGMLLYPLGYSLVVLPVSVIRWYRLDGHYAVKFFAVSLFYLSGAVNVLLFLIVRPGLLLFPRPERLYEQEVAESAPQPPSEDAGPATLPDSANVRCPGSIQVALADEHPGRIPVRIEI